MPLQGRKGRLPKKIPLPGGVGFEIRVGATGFEPATSCSRSRRATGLRYAPKRQKSPQIEGERHTITRPARRWEPEFPHRTARCNTDCNSQNWTSQTHICDRLKSLSINDLICVIGSAKLSCKTTNQRVLCAVVTADFSNPLRLSTYS